MPAPYFPVFPAELAGCGDASLVCIASGQYFGCLRDLVFYRGDRSIYCPVDALIVSLPRNCRLTRRPVGGQLSAAGGIIEFYLDGHLIGMKSSGRPYVCLLMDNRVAVRVGDTSPRFFHCRGGKFRECFRLVGSTVRQPAVTVRVNGRVLTPRRQRAVRSTSSGTPASRGISKRRRGLR